jgi:hypothetical protein
MSPAVRPDVPIGGPPANAAVAATPSSSSPLLIA